MELNEREVNVIERTFVVTGVLLAVIFSLFCLAVLLWPAEGARAAEPVKHAFVGVEKCGMCHKSDAKGNQLKAWKDSKHSHAYEILGTDRSKEVAKQAGVTGDPQKTAECLQCHVAAFGAAAELKGEKFHMEDGVQCENCHGAGADYAKIPVMKDKAKAVAAGLVIPTEATCRGCHNEKAPTWDPKKGFDFKESLKKIAHKRPQAQEAPAAKAK